MWELIKKYWDIIIGAACAVVISIIARFEIEKIQLCYSIIILILVCIGIMRVIKREVEKKKEKRHSIIDNIVDAQSTLKAISLAQQPTREGEKIGNLIIIFWGGLKKTMYKFKTFLDKFKGIILAIALGILSIVEMCGGFINTLFGEALTIKGVEIIPLITLVAAVTVGIISNGYTKEQKEKIKALFTKSTSETLVLEEIKKTIKDKTAQLKKFNQVLSTQMHELANFESELETLTNTRNAKQEMFNMKPQLATAEDVQLANNAVVDCQAKIEDKKAEIEKTKATIETLTTTINALKSQVQ